MRIFGTLDNLNILSSDYYDVGPTAQPPKRRVYPPGRAKITRAERRQRCPMT